MQRLHLFIWVGLTFASGVVVLLLPPLAQNQTYHEFADQRTLLGILHFFNVVSNFPFLFVGAAGLLFVWSRGFAAIGSGRFEQCCLLVLERIERSGRPASLFFCAVLSVVSHTLHSLVFSLALYTE